MSDKTRFHERRALVARQYARTAEIAAERERRFPSPTCKCGLTYSQVETLWCVSGDRGTPTRFYCRTCAPPGLRAELGLPSNK